MSRKRLITARPAGKQTGEKCHAREDRLRRKLNEIFRINAGDPEHARKFAADLKRLAHDLCSLHLKQKALFDFKWDRSLSPSGVPVALEIQNAEDAMAELEREICAAIERQQCLLGTVELRATLLQVRLNSPTAR